ncbi:Smr/MutS family protein [Paracoccus aerodenitrificans]|uniref:Smr/MutS family protein n=1 Tax=Paracoccus aerodenitrificans TaxID=3017781 RepID=UPI0022F00ED8|nr:Smr/MutS family protein [Paracoccus aerodenitrificans]WBU63802.1 Smr/MutS family protein [Paracoccus aerodenitrificans]
MARKRGLSPEDTDLWRRAMRNTTPLHPERRGDTALNGTSQKPSEKAKPSEPPQPAEGFPLPPEIRLGSRAGNTPKLNATSARPDTPGAGQLRMDRKLHKQMSKGKLRPEARLDLHGMTLAEADPELTAFILSCHANGLRLVLVITGKGRGRDPGPLPTRPGALRHHVPYWLHRPHLSRVVQQVTTAHLRHGGEGAYYVYLRR